MKIFTIRAAATAVVLVLGAACSGESAEQTELTRAQKHRLVAEMPITGASGVSGAMEARDRANARTADHDSIGNTP